MADVIKKATRESYGEALRDLAEEYPQLVVLDADLAAATKTGIFKKAYPDRFFDCGIAEINGIDDDIAFAFLNEAFFLFELDRTGEVFFSDFWLLFGWEEFLGKPRNAGENHGDWPDKEIENEKRINGN